MLSDRGSTGAISNLEGVQVLIVDDNRQMRLLLRTILRGFGLRRCFEASDAVEAFEVMRSTYVDLVLVDWNMDPIDGIEFTQMLRTAADSPNPYATVIMVTGHAERSRVAAARDAGVHSFLVKPISARSLMAHLSNAFADSRPFVFSPSFTGPDRRRGRRGGYQGPMRRTTDVDASDDAFDVG